MEGVGDLRLVGAMLAGCQLRGRLALRAANVDAQEQRGAEVVGQDAGVVGEERGQRRVPEEKSCRWNGASAESHAAHPWKRSRVGLRALAPRLRLRARVFDVR